MKKITREIIDFTVRYGLILFLAIPNFWIFYKLFSPITTYVVFLLLNLFYDVNLVGEVIFISNCFPIEIVSACIAGSAYYLLFALNLATPKIQIGKRGRIILLSFACLFVLNLIRILLLSFLFISGSAYLDITHKLFWYVLSTIFVAGIWFMNVKLFKIKEIPFYSDLKYLYKKIKK